MAVENSLSIGALSKATGTTLETIGWYERVGVVSPPVRTKGNYRSYGAAHLERQQPRQEFTRTASAHCDCE